MANLQERVGLPLAFILLVASAAGQDARHVAQKTFPSVALLVMQDAHGQPIKLGSGFFVAEGIVATNLHVVEGASGGYAKLVGQKTKHEIAGTVGVDRKRDLVLLSVPSVHAPLLPLGNGNQSEIGDEVYAVGNPEGFEGTFSQGIVSGIREFGSETLLQITAPISPGSSGGPVLNSEGQVVGIAVGTYKSGQNLNFAIPVTYLVSLISTKTNVKPLTALKSPIPTARSLFGAIGTRNTEGVVGSHFLWDRNYDKAFSFSLRNQLAEEVTNIRWLVIFYDRSGKPIDVQEGHLPPTGRVRPGLAIRVEDFAGDGVSRLTWKVEIRILDFRIVQ